MRLVDVDWLLENYGLKNMQKYNPDGSLNREATNTLMLYEIADMIDSAPTVCDLDKVTEELKNKSIPILDEDKSDAQENGLSEKCEIRMVSLSDAIEIVGNGGVS